MRYLLTLLFVPLLFIGCAQADMETNEHSEYDDSPEFDELVAVIHPTEGNDISGVVRFTREDDGVRVHAEVHGLDAESLHGFHIHEFGDCTSSDGTSAGGHFDPHGSEHGAPTDEDRHVGDLGNLPADENGVAEVNYVDEKLSFDGIDSILGRGLIVHADEDDLVSQPVGDAGARLGCGVIGVAQTD